MEKKIKYIGNFYGHGQGNTGSFYGGWSNAYHM